MSKYFFLLLIFLSAFDHGSLLRAQTPQALSSADILLGLKKLNVLGSVLYVAAHPDDENTRLLAYFSKEKLYRTGYLSLTRGDGGQNLIGNEQGIELGLIRTQELLAARRIDGAEQFFTRAYDFGFSKSTEEALKTWNKEKILSDVVWVIRKFQPDIILTRFPQDARAGHGHHSASAVLAVEAFTVAADPSRFPEQLKYVKPWQAKRIMWNAGFGGGNQDSLFRLEVGMFNPVLGKSYGEIASESRSQHKSQGFGIARQRGSLTESFSLWKGDAPKKDLMEGIDQSWNRIEGGERIQEKINTLISGFSLFAPGKSVRGLVDLYQSIRELPAGYWKDQKLKEVASLIEACSGLWLEATTNDAMAVQTTAMNVNFFVNNRNGNAVSLKRIRMENYDTSFNSVLETNKNFTVNKSFYISENTPVTQPYWLRHEMDGGSFSVNDQLLIGNPDVEPSYTAIFTLNIEGQDFEIRKPVRYKYTDPVKGEVYQPVIVIPPVLVKPDKNMLLVYNSDAKNLHLTVQGFKNVPRPLANLQLPGGWQAKLQSMKSIDTLARGAEVDFLYTISPVTTLRKGSNGSSVSGKSSAPKNMVAGKPGKESVAASVEVNGKQYSSLLRSISYDHIPDVTYFRTPVVNMVSLDLKTVGKRIGYIEGAGDYVLNALQQMGYEVKLLSDNDLANGDLSGFDAIITGVRAYNTRESLSTYYSRLMQYVEQGGNLIVQYNTSTQIGPLKAKIGPYPFSISRTRVTDENAQVKILKPTHQVLNYPNKITAADFENWVQERSIYHAEKWDSIHYETIFAMHDPNEKDDRGSLIMAKYGKGVFVYTGLVFYRELPAGVPGAYRLLANLIALNKKRA